MREPCGNCDTCLTPVETWDATTAARKAISAVLRTEQRFGTAHLIDLLLGVENDKILRFGHEKLPTFGVGKELDRKGWGSVFRQLIVRGVLEVDHGSYGALLATAMAKPILRGEEPVHLRRDQAGRSALNTIKKKEHRSGGAIRGVARGTDAARPRAGRAGLCDLP
jgi:ATP-dependent DNA helicase RecQ